MEKQKNTGIIAAIAAAALTVLIIAIYVYAGPYIKISRAVRKTFVPDKLMQDMSAVDYINTGNYTADFDGKLSYRSRPDIDIKANYIQDAVNKTQSMTGSIGFQGIDIVYNEYLDKNYVYVSVPFLTDRTIVYDYRNGKTGYLTYNSYVKDFFDGSDTVFQNCYDNLRPVSSEIDRGVLKVIAKDIRKTGLKKTGKKEFVIDGKKTGCKGYSLTMTKEQYKDMLRDIDDYNSKEKGLSSGYLEGLLDRLDKSNTNVMWKSMADADNYTVHVYLYKNRIGAIDIDFDDEYKTSMELVFQGGLVPYENAEFSYTDVSGRNIRLISEGSSTKNAVHIKYRGETDGVSVQLGSVDYENNQLECDLGYRQQTVHIKTKIIKAEESIKFKDLLILSGSDSNQTELNGDICIKQGGTVEVLKNNNPFDIGNASETEIKSFVTEVALNKTIGKWF